MPADSESDIQFEIDHILLIDIVGYSKLLINAQREQLQTLNEIVRNTPQFRTSDANGMLVRLPTGDGMALIFRDNLEAPARCALEISRALRSHPEIRLRMGIHSGPVSDVKDVNERSNIAGAGIDIAQRVMDCGDAGHILLSKRVADDLAPYPRWNPNLHDLGECEVKHGVKLSLVNLYTDEVGNPALPTRLGLAKTLPTGARRGLTAFQISIIAAIVLVCLGVPALIFTPAILKSLRSKPNSQTSAAPAVAAPVPEKSIAVLPFENLSRDPDNAYFADGIQEEVLTRLAKIADLKVISRTSTQRFKSSPDNLPQIAKQLGVTNVLQGSVQKSADQVRALYS